MRLRGKEKRTWDGVTRESLVDVDLDAGVGAWEMESAITLSQMIKNLPTLVGAREADRGRASASSTGNLELSALHLQ